MGGGGGDLTEKPVCRSHTCYPSTEDHSSDPGGRLTAITSHPGFAFLQYQQFEWVVSMATHYRHHLS